MGSEKEYDMKPTFFHVTDGLYNGEAGEQALDTSGRQLQDGWYWLVDDGLGEVGPFPSRDAAEKDAAQ